MRQRGGVTLIETLLMTALALFLMAAAYGLMQRSNRLTDAASHNIDLQVGVRNLLENMVRDVGTCQQVLDPGRDPTTKLVVVKPGTDDLQDRLSRNTDKAFPFVSSANDRSPQKMKALKVTYAFEPGRHTVRRTEEDGEFTAQTRSHESFLTEFSFRSSATLSDRELAASVETFDLRLIGYDSAGQLKFVAPPELPFERTAVVAVHLVAQFDEGLYRDAGNKPRIEIATKIWSMKRRSDEVYKEYFSSTDEDLRW